MSRYIHVILNAAKNPRNSWDPSAQRVGEALASPTVGRPSRLSRSVQTGETPVLPGWATKVAPTLYPQNDKRSLEKKIRLALRLMCILATFFISYTSHAGDTGLDGFNIQSFRPTADGIGLYNVSSSEVLPHKSYSFGLYTNLSHGVASVVMPARATSVALIDNNVTGDIVGAVGLFNFMDAGIALPVAFYQDGHDFRDLTKYKTAALGDMRLDLKFRVLKDKRGSLGTAFISRATFPTGSRSKFTGYDGPTWEGALLVGKSFKPVSFFANVGYRFLKSLKILSTTVDDQLTFGGGVRVPIPLGDRSWSVIAEAAGETVVRDMKEVSTPVEVRGGIRKEFKNGLAINFGGGTGVTDAFGSPDYRFFAGISFNAAMRKKAAEEAIAAEPVEKISDTVHFSFNRAKIPSAEYPRLREIGELLANNKALKVKVDGHADSIGSRKYNEALSRKRAQEVKKYLISFGAEADQIDVNSYGETHPVATNKTPEGRRKNRRTEISTY